MKRDKPKKSLEKFVLAKKQAVCRVCALPATVTKQLADRDPRVHLVVALEWLKTEWGITISELEYTWHHHAGHSWRKPR